MLSSANASYLQALNVIIVIYVLCVTLQSVCNIFMVCIGLLDTQQCEVIAFVWLMLSLYSVFVPCTNFTPCGISILIPLYPLASVSVSLICTLSSTKWTLFTGSSVEFDLLWTLICTLYNQQCTVLCTWDSQSYQAGYKTRQRFDTDQIWQSYRGIHDRWEGYPLCVLCRQITCQFLKYSHLIWETRASYKSCLKAIFVPKA